MHQIPGIPKENKILTVTDLDVWAHLVSVQLGTTGAKPWSSAGFLFSAPYTALLGRLKLVALIKPRLLSAPLNLFCKKNHMFSGLMENPLVGKQLKS